MSNSPLISAEYVEEMLLTLIETLKDVISSPHVLHQARKNLNTLAESDPIPWRLEITRDNPLRFNKSKNQRGAKLIPELCCIIDGGINDTQPFSNSKIELKLKSDDWGFIYRKEWDSPEIEKKMVSMGENERVMFRCHFDYGEKTFDGEPTYHISYGGVPHNDELCWVPSELRNPRISFMPLDLVLACEIVVSNFFPEKYVALQSIPEWRNIVYFSEHVILYPIVQQYARRCAKDITMRRIDNDPTLLWSNWLIEEQS